MNSFYLIHTEGEFIGYTTSLTFLPSQEEGKEKIGLKTATFFKEKLYSKGKRAEEILSLYSFTPTSSLDDPIFLGKTIYKDYIFLSGSLSITKETCEGKDMLFSRVLLSPEEGTKTEDLFGEEQ